MLRTLSMITCLVFIMSFAVGLTDSAGEESPFEQDTIRTHIGDLTFDHGVPTKETSEKLYYEMDYHRAVQTYLWSLPIVGQAQWRQSYRDLYDMQPNQMIYMTQFNDRSLILTANESTPYLIPWTNVKDKAAIIEVPPGAIIGLCIDFWQRGLADWGMFGPFSGNGGTWVIRGNPSSRVSTKKRSWPTLCSSVKRWPKTWSSASVCPAYCAKMAGV